MKTLNDYTEELRTLLAGISERTEQTNPQAALFAALARAQAAATNVSKNAVAKLGAGREYHYATLDVMRDALRPLLAAEGLALLGRMAEGGILWRLSHVEGGSDEWLTPYPDGATTPHTLGSAVTYLTRYQLALVLGVAAEDDDDGHAAQEVAATTTNHAPTPAPAPAPKTAPTPAPATSTPDDPDVQDAKARFFRAYRAAGLPTDSNEARRERDRLIYEALGTRTYFTKLTAEELDKITAHMKEQAGLLANASGDEEPDPFRE